MYHIAIISVNFDIQEWCVRLLYSLLPLTYKNNKPCCYILFWFWHNHYNNPVNFFPKNNCTVNLFVAVLRLNYTGTSNNNIHWCLFHIFEFFSIHACLYFIPISVFCILIPEPIPTYGISQTHSFTFKQEKWTHQVSRNSDFTNNVWLKHYPDSTLMDTFPCV